MTVKSTKSEQPGFLSAQVLSTRQHSSISFTDCILLAWWENNLLIVESHFVWIRQSRLKVQSIEKDERLVQLVWKTQPVLYINFAY